VRSMAMKRAPNVGLGKPGIVLWPGEGMKKVCRRQAGLTL
jgi:hypothetical protein